MEVPRAPRTGFPRDGAVVTRLGPLIVTAGDPFGVARRSAPGVGDAEVIVRPRIHEIVAPVAAGGRVAAGDEDAGVRSIASDLGHEFLTLRNYELGDDLRRVHWRSTARTGELMIRQDESRWRSRAAVVLDVAAGAHDDHSFEVAVEAAASVMARLVRLQRRVELITGTGAVLGTGGGSRHEAIDRLATVALDPDDHLPTVLESVGTRRGVDLVVAVLGRASPDTLRALASLAGIGVVLVLTQPTHLVSTPSTVVIDASTTPFALAWNQAFAGGRPQHVTRR